MDIHQFQRCAAQLLKKHYGLALNDTHLCDEAFVTECVSRGWRPFQVIAEHAEDADLVRVDLQGDYGVASKAPITAADELAALKEIQ